MANSSLVPPAIYRAAMRLIPAVRSSAGVCESVRSRPSLQAPAEQQTDPGVRSQLPRF